MLQQKNPSHSRSLFCGGIHRLTILQRLIAGIAALCGLVATPLLAGQLPEKPDAWTESLEGWEGFDLGRAAFHGQDHRPGLVLLKDNVAAGKAAVATEPFNTEAVASNLGLTFRFPEPLDLSGPDATVCFRIKVDTTENHFSVHVALGEYSPELDSQRDTRIIFGDGNLEALAREGWMEFSIPVSEFAQNAAVPADFLHSVSTFTIFVGGIGDEDPKATAVLAIDDLRIENAEPARTKPAKGENR